jgi:hypothetical protein
MFGVYNGVRSKWVDQQFVPVSAEEAERFNRGTSGGVFRNVNGWSGTTNISKREPGTHTYPLMLRGVPSEVVAVQNSNLQSVSVRIGDSSLQLILEVRLEPTYPDRASYEKLFSAGFPVK